MKWREVASQRRRTLPSGLLPRLALGVSGLALAALNVALYLQDGMSRPLVASAALSGGYLVLAYMLVRLRESKLEAEAALVENQQRSIWEGATTVQHLRRVERQQAGTPKSKQPHALLFADKERRTATHECQRSSVVQLVSAVPSHPIRRLMLQ